MTIPITADGEVVSVSDTEQDTDSICWASPDYQVPPCGHLSIMDLERMGAPLVFPPPLQALIQAGVIPSPLAMGQEEREMESDSNEPRPRRVGMRRQQTGSRDLDRALGPGRQPRLRIRAISGMQNGVPMPPFMRRPLSEDEQQDTEECLVQ